MVNFATYQIDHKGASVPPSFGRSAATRSIVCDGTFGSDKALVLWRVGGHRLVQLLCTFYGHDSLLLASFVVPVWIQFFRSPTLAQVHDVQTAPSHWTTNNDAFAHMLSLVSPSQHPDFVRVHGDLLRLSVSKLVKVDMRNTIIRRASDLPTRLHDCFVHLDVRSAIPRRPMRPRADTRCWTLKPAPSFASFTARCVTAPWT